MTLLETDFLRKTVHVGVYTYQIFIELNNGELNKKNEDDITLDFLRKYFKSKNTFAISLLFK